MKIIRGETVDLHVAFSRIEKAQLFRCKRCQQVFAISWKDAETIRTLADNKTNNLLGYMTSELQCCPFPTLRYADTPVTLLTIEPEEKGGD